MLCDVLIAACLGLFFVTYAAYPLFVAVLARLRAPRAPVRVEDPPFVSFIVIARDEHAVIRAKVANCLTLDYPEDRLEVLVVSDGSGDGTDDAVRAFADPRVRLLALPEPAGKTAAAWAGVEAARGAVLVFSDATSEFEEGAVRALVEAVLQPGVGCATGRVRYTFAGAAVSDGFRAYQRVNVAQRRAEARVATATVVSGTIHAVRRAVFAPVPNDVSYDTALPLLAAIAGLRTVYVDDARAVEVARERVASEWRARVRIGVRCWRFVPYLLRRAREVRLRAYLVQVTAHKLGRWFSAPALVVLLLAGVVGLFTGARLAGVALALEGALLGAALLGVVAGRLGVRVPGAGLALFFVTVNAAYVVALSKVLAGRSVTGWAPER
jgi:cellulose synthase/poly-beta-1,6-N-acetylglucosamine synthase-like glycosyltransferase